MKVNNKETFQGSYLGDDLGTGHALTIYDQIPKEANSSDNKKHIRFKHKGEAWDQRKALNFQCFDIQFKGT